jgi:uncharacterized protein YwqG
MNLQEAADLIQANLPEHIARDLVAALRPSIRLYPEPIELDELPIGASRLGGVPDLPAGFDWPKWITRKMVGHDGKKVCYGEPEEIALNFMAQINLQDVAHLDPQQVLPKNGWLVFFYDCETYPGGSPGHEDGARVFHIDADSAQLQRVYDHYLEAQVEPQPVARLRFEKEMSLPRELDCLFEVTEEGWPLIQRVLFQINKREQEFDPMHRMFGNAYEMQGPMDLECELLANGVDLSDDGTLDTPERQRLTGGAADWRLLLQLDSDDDLNWMWGDQGKIYYWIREQDLYRHAFGEAWCMCQC